MTRLVAVLAVILAAVTAAAASREPTTEWPGWSRPMTITTAAVEARPAMVVDAQDRAQIFFIDRDGGRGVVRWITAGIDGRILAGPRTLGEADLRARALAAAADGGEIRVIWVTPSGEEMRVLATRIRETGVDPPESLSHPVEDAGPVALAPSAPPARPTRTRVPGTRRAPHPQAGTRYPAPGAHAAWSQASGGRRTIWYQGPGIAPAEVAVGDAPALSVGLDGPWIVWWRRVGFDAYRLVAASLRAGELPIHVLTGNLATARLQPPAAAHDGAGRLHVVFGTEQRGFGPAVGRLSLLDVGSDGTASPRRTVAPGSPFAAGATAALWGGTVAFAWTDLRSGRSRNPEIYVGFPTGGGLAEHRLTYSLTASALPALARGPGAALTAVWLEVAPGGRFALQLASTARPAARRFLLGVPELDVYRPGAAAAFALTALIGTLPYAVLTTLATALLSAAAIVAGRAVFGATRWWAWLAASGSRAAVAALALALVCLTAVTAVIPLVPKLPLPAAAGVLVLAWAWSRLRRASLTLWHQTVLVLLGVFGTSVALAFASAARTLSQLTT